MRKLTVIFIGIILLGCLSELKGQVPMRGHFGQVMIGHSWVDMSDLSEGLRDQQYAELINGFTAVGLGYEHWRGKWIFGLDSYNFMSQRQKFNGSVSVLSFHYGLVRVGYAIPTGASNWRVFPTVGAGGGFSQLQLEAFRFNEFINNTYWTGGPLLEFAVRAKCYFELDPEKGYRGSYGFSAGYVHVPNAGWFLQNLGVNDRAYLAQPAGFFVRVSLGMGSVSSK